MAIPSHWTTTSGVNMVMDMPAITAFQTFLMSTWRSKYTKDRKGSGPVPEGVRVTSVIRVENHEILARYTFYRQKVCENKCDHFPVVTDGRLLLDPPVALDASINEMLLFHGTNPIAADAIARTAFRLDKAGSAKGTMFGPGIYLAENVSKSDEYAKEGDGVFTGQFAILVCRAVAGRVLIVTDAGNYKPRVDSGEADTVCGDRLSAVGTFREMIFFDEAAVMPEYIVLYMRAMCKADVPSAPVGSAAAAVRALADTAAATAAAAAPAAAAVPTAPASASKCKRSGCDIAATKPGDFCCGACEQRPVGPIPWDPFNSDGSVKWWNHGPHCAKRHYTTGAKFVLPEPPKPFRKDTEWVKVFHHDVEACMDKFKKDDFLFRNQSDETSPAFSRLGDLDNFRAADGSLTFWMRWPGTKWPDAVWSQTTNPCTSTSVSGFKFFAGAAEYINPNWQGGFKGLMLADDCNTKWPDNCCLKGCGDQAWFYAVGLSKRFLKSGDLGYPGPHWCTHPFCKSRGETTEHKQCMSITLWVMKS
ncbi:unnamed protein product [Polarella glacialis]|uniref:PARP catalytic domain-containing protein n=1 Tax=Polarella glacialis TaxID=89957 RepID=A0A813KG91_POLGL|nr:unnamed protein product [Polarella glacialis]CAE8699848.1 unnamed protein product [Polarella glacialis]|mmetsp:Transcript_77914/g.140597  ORF Transcript_77914/g.140597 Transcript_77914/m.140597 type:complete len:532 (+) Transcript_77914:69-1664(+)